MVQLVGRYVETFTRHASNNWDQLCKDHESEFPKIRECFHGTFNVRLENPKDYEPPSDSEYRKRVREKGKSDGNHIAPRARVIGINGTRVEAWIYRGNPDSGVVELVSTVGLQRLFSITNDTRIILDIEEVEEGTIGMPAPPP